MRSPAGVPQLLFTRHIAAALNITTNQVKYMLDAGLLEHRRLMPNGQRFVTPAELIVFAVRSGLELDWSAALDT